MNRFLFFFLFFWLGNHQIRAQIEQCLATMYSTCTYENGTFPSQSGMLANSDVQNRRKRDFVNCYEDGTCVTRNTPNRDTCCKICKSCTFQGCCHCSFTDSAKYCPIPGWRASDYTGDSGRIVPRDGLGGCGDPVDFGNRLHDRAMQLLFATMLLQFSGQLFAPYLRYNWQYVDPNNNRPNDGFVIVRAMEGNGEDRVDYMERYIIPSDLRDRAGSFSTANRDEWMFELDGNFLTDEAGHILANTLGGPNTRYNFFPQHATVNRNLEGRWLMDSWVDTEYAMRAFLREGRPGSYILFRVLLIYPNDSTGRPNEIAWSAVFIDPSLNNTDNVVRSMGGRVYNDGVERQGPQGVCPRPRPSG